MSKKLIKNISFRQNEDEIRLLEHANSKRNFSEWVKQKLEEDLFNRPPVHIEKPIEIEIDDNLL